MRVISGEFKGRQIQPVPNQLTRPTTDKVKEALFQIIGPFFNGGNCFDLFAGSGGLGIEALSRGMDQAVFVDKHPKAIKTIYSNIKMLQLESQTEVFRADAFRAIKAAAKRGLVFELVFLDPPYGKISYENLLEAIIENQLLTPEGMVVCEHQAEEELPLEFGVLERIKTETYGNTTGISIYKRKEQ